MEEKKNQEIIEYQQFFRIGEQQIKGLQEKYQLTGEKKYLDAQKQVAGLLEKAKQLDGFYVPLISEDSSLGLLEYTTREDAKRAYFDFKKEKLFTIV